MVKDDTILLLGALGVGGYLLSKTDFFKGLGDITGGAGDAVKGAGGAVASVASETAETFKAPADFFQSIFNLGTGLVEDFRDKSSFSDVNITPLDVQPTAEIFDPKTNLIHVLNTDGSTTTRPANSTKQTPSFSINPFSQAMSLSAKTAIQATSSSSSSNPKPTIGDLSARNALQTNAQKIANFKATFGRDPKVTTRTDGRISLR